MPRTAKKNTTDLTPRRCKYCRGNFVPERAQDKDAKFCCPNHRKAYWRYGGLPFDKMRDQIMKDVRRELKAQHAEILAMLANIPGVTIAKI
jgi:hypothetical protein